jgi:hypothetical protein
MPISRKITSLQEPLDIDLQLIAFDLDTSVKDMKYLSKLMMNDAISIDAFDKLCEDIERGEGIEITSFDDNSKLYEYLDEAIIIHEILGIKYIIFDTIITQKLENKMNSYK